MSEANDLQSPEGIAIDWLSRHVYWVDSGKRTIEVANMESRSHKILVDSCDVCDYDNCCLKKPRGLAVDPSSRYNIISVYIEGEHKLSTLGQIFK